MNFVHGLANPQEVLWIATSDHGSMLPIEQLKKMGYTNAHRINKERLLEKLNNKLEKRFDTKNIVRFIDIPDLYINHTVFDDLDRTTQKQIVLYINRYLLKFSGIKKVWTQKMLSTRSFEPDQFESFYKNQLFAGRSGDLIVQIFPYTVLSKNEKGSSHKSPYWYDTHVPLIIYQKGTVQQKKINKPVWVPQITKTLATLLKTPNPSSATFDALPEVIKS